MDNAFSRNKTFCDAGIYLALEIAGLLRVLIP